MPGVASLSLSLSPLLPLPSVRWCGPGGSPIARLSLADNLVQATGLRPLKRVYVRGRERGDVVLVPVETEAVLTALANQEAQLEQVLERMAQAAAEPTGLINEN